MMFPDCLKLDEKQKALFMKFHENFPKTEGEDCCGTSSYTFECISSGIGDIIIAKRGNKEIHLEYNDDGLLIGES